MRLDFSNSKLPVINKHHTNAGFSFKKTVCCDSQQRISYEVTGGTKSKVLITRSLPCKFID